jgi:hypothetical protein
MMITELERRAANDNRRPSHRTRADEQFTMIGIALWASVLFVAIMWVPA